MSEVALDTEVILVRNGEAVVRHCPVNVRGSDKSTGYVVDVDVKDLGRVDKRRPLEIDENLAVRGSVPVIENTEPATKGRLAVPENVVSKTDTRTYSNCRAIDDRAIGILNHALVGSSRRIGRA